MSDIYVCKFGGSSLAQPGDLSHLVDTILPGDEKRSIISPSAPGKRFSDDIKITDHGISYAKTGDEEHKAKIIARFESLYPGSSSRIENEIDKIGREDLTPKLALHSFTGLGERIQAQELARVLGWEYIGPEFFRVENGRVLAKPTRELLSERLKIGRKYVVCGFQGLNSEGKIEVLNRGGTDTSAAHVAVAVGAVMYENFSDRDGILAADPKYVNNPLKIDEITFWEIRCLSYSGFGIIHAESLQPVAQERIPVHVRSTSNFPSEGTYIVHDRISSQDKPLVGVAYQGGFCSFDVERFGMNEEIGIVAGVVDVFSRRGISIEYIPTGIDDFSVVLRQEQIEGKQDIGRIINDIYGVVGESTDVEFKQNLGCLVVAGKELKGRRGTLADVAKTLAEARVNIEIHSQGRRERSMVFGILAEDGPKAVNAVYDKYLREAS
jgi:aspartate kinase